MITRDEVLKGQLCPIELEANLERLLAQLNEFRVTYGRPLYVTSGYRTLEHNSSIGGRTKSAHLTCEACDFSDPHKELAKWILENLSILESCDLYMEDPEHTPTWVHLQTRKASRRVFLP